MDTRKSNSCASLSLIAESIKQFTFPNLKRPPVPAKAPATRELVNWGAQVYCFSWMRHFCTLLNGIVLLKEAGNTPSARIVARSVFELGAHAYYVKKHLKQHIDAGDFSAAWKAISTSSPRKKARCSLRPRTSARPSTPLGRGCPKMRRKVIASSANSVIQTCWLSPSITSGRTRKQLRSLTTTNR